MQLSRVLALVVSGCCLILGPSLRAQAPAPAPASGPAWTPDKQFSTDETITTSSGRTMTGKTYYDHDKIRSEMHVSGMDVVSIVRPDEKKVFSLMPAQKMVLEMPLTEETLKQFSTLSSSGDPKCDFVEPAAIDGVACNKYKMISPANNKVFYWWINVATKTPVRFQAEDGSVTLAFSNYKAGPMDASLFEVPPGYKTMQMPAGAPPSAPAGQ